MNERQQAGTVVADAQDLASFALLRGRVRETQAFLWAFDLLVLDGEDLRGLPLERRKERLKALLKRAPFGLALNDYVAVRAGLRHGPRGDRVEAAELALPVGPLAALAQTEEPGEPGSASRGVRGLGQEGAVSGERTIMHHYHDMRLVAPAVAVAHVAAAPASSVRFGDLRQKWKLILPITSAVLSILASISAQVGQTCLPRLSG